MRNICGLDYELHAYNVFYPLFQECIEKKEALNFSNFKLLVKACTQFI